MIGENEQISREEMALITCHDPRCQKFAGIVKPILEEEGCRLIRICITQTGKRLNVQIMAERKDGQNINLEDCSVISRLVSVQFDVEDSLSESYVLEISSPGLDRPLTRKSDFERFQGHFSKIELAYPLEGRKRFRATIQGIEGDNILIKTEQTVIALPFPQIASAALRYQEGLQLNQEEPLEHQEPSYLESM